MDKTAIVFDRIEQAQVATLSGHTKRVTDVCFHPSKEQLLLTASADKTARVWQAVEGDAGGGYKVAHVLDDHDAEVVGATVHATGDFMATASKDKSWAFYDINRCVAKKVSLFFVFRCVIVFYILGKSAVVGRVRLYAWAVVFILVLGWNGGWLRCMVLACTLIARSRFSPGSMCMFCIVLLLFCGHFGTEQNFGW